MPQVSIIRAAGTARRVGDSYGFADGGRSFTGTVIRVTPMRKAKQHVAVTIELTEDEHKRLMMGGADPA